MIIWNTASIESNILLKAACPNYRSAFQRMPSSSTARPYSSGLPQYVPSGQMYPDTGAKKSLPKVTSLTQVAAVASGLLSHTFAPGSGSAVVLQA